MTRLVCPMRPRYSAQHPELLGMMGYSAGLFLVPTRGRPFTPWREAPPHPVFLYGGVTPGKVSDRMMALCSRFPYVVKAVLFTGKEFWPRLRFYAGVPLWRVTDGPHIKGAWPYVCTTPWPAEQDIGRLQGWVVSVASWRAHREAWCDTFAASRLPVFLDGPTPSSVARLFGEVGQFLGDH